MYSVNDLSAVWCQAITLTYTGFWGNPTLGNKNQSDWNLNTTIFIQEKEFENGVCKMAAILFLPEGKYSHIPHNHTLKIWAPYK